ncbi:MAG: tetratricopeptide repeat protein [Planctomycetales bacterium]|nr:tetratricopeptide repeat protein [Planctomycetales bacterium]
MANDSLQKLDECLSVVEEKLAADIDPGLEALALLGVQRMGALDRSYHDDAFAIWERQLTGDDEQDFLVLHHLAIMHHSRAIDLERGSKPARSDRDWERSLDLWRRLIGCDAFWARIQDTASRDRPQHVEAVRERLPVSLLRMHYDVALHAATKNHRAQFHLRLVRKGPFPEEMVNQAQSEVYKEHTTKIEDDAWSPNLLDADRIGAAMEIVEQYLRVDSDCIPALSDLLTFQDRLISAWFPEYRAAGDDEAQQNQVLRRIQQLGERWKKHIDSLAQSARALDEAAQSKLAQWYRIMGDVHMAMERLDAAREFYESGSQLPLESDNVSGCRKGLEDATIYAQLEAANRHLEKEEFARAESVLTKVLEAKPGHPRSLFLRCQTRAKLEKFDAALEDLAAFREAEPDQTAAAERLDSDISLKKADSLIKGKQFDRALAVLNQAARKHPRNADVLFLRCHCHIQLNNEKPARKDVELLREVADGDQDLLQAADRLEKKVASMGVGKELDAVQEAMENKKFSIAINQLNSIIRKHPDEAIAYFLRCQCYMATENLSGARTDLASFRSRASDPDARAAADRIQEQLHEMVQLKLDFGNMRALELFSEGAKTFSSNQLKGLDLMREALVASGGTRSGDKINGGARKIKSQLSQALVSSVYKMHELTSGLSNPTREAVEALLDMSKKLALEALHYDPSNKQAMDILKQMGG